MEFLAKAITVSNDILWSYVLVVMLIALGVLLGVFLAMKRESRLGLAKDTTIDLALVALGLA